MGVPQNGEQLLYFVFKRNNMIEMISPLLRKFAFSNLIRQSKQWILPFTECPSDNTYCTEQKESTAPEKPVSQNAVELFSVFTADIIRKEVVFFR